MAAADRWSGHGVPGGAVVDPLLKEDDLSRRESRSLRRHELCARTGNILNETTACRIAWQNVGAEVTSLESPRPVVEAEPARVSGGAVAAEAALCEDRQDLGAKID